MPRHAVATVDEIPPGGRKIVEVAGRSIGIFNVDGVFYALRNRCPHQGGELCRGNISGFVTATKPGEYRTDRPGQILRCPWHGWEFDITTGQSWFDPSKVRVRQYEVTVQPVIPTDDPDAWTSGLERGPYVAETYPVSVERQVVMVEIGD
jgi:3-phenylpropionate/trans-cinnamate dioxygenase ferredoxin subunit